MVRAIRGATTADSNTREAILEASGELVKKIMEVNGISPDDIAAVMFTITPDLNKVFPAVAVRQMGITDVPLLDFAQPTVEGALEKCVRVMILVNTSAPNGTFSHVYLKGARILRPDIPSQG